ncbi:MAG TPA: lysylphosphatidylglycerol synthase domain-containing protein [Steroidobacteraceae bacterium]|nr:lysylphosphatidylglycerol synthase domain-containing protein [Steroidobacteraceae bacterium]
MMSGIGIVLAALGLIAVATIVHVADAFPSILSALSGVGPVVLLLVPLHAIPLALDARGWRELLPAEARLRTLLWIATIREAINRLLPAANVGGEIVGIRLLALSGQRAAVAAASVIVETVVTLFSQYLFVALGLLCLLRVTGSVPWGGDLLLGFGLSLPLLALPVILLRRGTLFAALTRLLQRLSGRWAAQLAEGSAGLDAEIGHLYTVPSRWVAAGLWQYCGLLAGCAETWLALRWLGHPVSLPGAIALESATQALRNFIFFVPAGLGVQELGLMGVGHLIGLSSETAIALSLIKRMREILFGLPALASWYWSEGRRGLQRVRERTL